MPNVAFLQLILEWIHLTFYEIINEELRLSMVKTSIWRQWAQLKETKLTDSNFIIPGLKECYFKVSFQRFNHRLIQFKSATSALNLSSILQIQNMKNLSKHHLY